MIIFINGASSSGKTQLARALQAQWAQPLLYFGLDDVISQLPVQYTGTGAEAAQGFPLAAVNDPGVPATANAKHQVSAGPLGLRLNQHAAGYLAQLGSEFDIVVDYVLLTDELLLPFVQQLVKIPVLFVGLTCADATLAARNAARPDRAPGLSLQQQQHIHTNRLPYDLRLDSSHTSASQLAKSLVLHVESNPPTAGFTATGL